MKTTASTLIIALSLAAAGCGGAAKNSTNAAAPNASAAPAVPAKAVANAAAPAATGVTSAYTEINLAQCQSLSADAESDSAAWRCPGYEGVPVFIASGDLRYDVDAGVDNGNFETMPPFNENPTRIEWRLRDGLPFAIIYRLTLATNEQTEWSGSALGIDTVGTAERPGCTIAWIDGAVPNANEVARQIADSRTATFNCAGGEPEQVRRPG